ncbi:hypothetical protein NC653_004649 [Populus alba x Populus x berolinensis]|uniref:Uncharacterized protein n=1 Tax=Populus alba x Populus x berolinensis TaxID=444605 RepID=A0AAD6RUV5_9ROSI|nr:hypothetical protein NC653_004649 [Populus alba x Populus x berolinensis]
MKWSSKDVLRDKLAQILATMRWKHGFKRGWTGVNNGLKSWLQIKNPFQALRTSWKTSDIRSLSAHCKKELKSSRISNILPNFTRYRRQLVMSKHAVENRRSCSKNSTVGSNASIRNNNFDICVDAFC